MFSQAEAHFHWPYGLRRSHSANGVKCIYAAQVLKALATVTPLRPWLPANWAGSSSGQKKTINCVAQVEKNGKKSTKIKKQRTAEIYLKGEKGTARAAEQRSVLEINTQLKPFANGHAPTPTARTWHICCRPIDAACAMARWHGELSWTELWLSWVYGRRRTKVGKVNNYLCLY